MTEIFVQNDDHVELSLEQMLSLPRGSFVHIHVSGCPPVPESLRARTSDALGRGAVTTIWNVLYHTACGVIVNNALHKITGAVSAADHEMRKSLPGPMRGLIGACPAYGRHTGSPIAQVELDMTEICRLHQQGIDVPRDIQLVQLTQHDVTIVSWDVGKGVSSRQALVHAFTQPDLFTLAEKATLSVMRGDEQLPGTAITPFLLGGEIVWAEKRENGLMEVRPLTNWTCEGKNVALGPLSPDATPALRALYQSAAPEPNTPLRKYYK